MKRLTKQMGKIFIMISICFIFLLFSKDLKVEAYEYTASNNYITYNGWGLITTEWNNTGKNNSYYRECYWYRPNGTHHHTSSDQGLSMQTKYSIAEAYQHAEGNWSTKFHCRSQNGYWSDHSANGGHYNVMNIWISHPSIGTATAPSSYYTWGDAGCWSKFSTSCSGRGTLSYQWQYYNPNSGAWQNIVASDFNGSTGINSTDLNLGTGTGGYPLSLNGYQVRCVVTATYANAKTCRFYNNTYQNDTWTGNTTCTSTSSGAYTYAYARPSITLTTTNPTGTSVDVVGVLSSANGVARVEYPTWTDNGGQDDMIWHVASLSGTTATYNVKSSEHKNETGEYITHAYVYTSSGEKVSCHNCVIRYTLGKSFELDPDYPEDKEYLLLEGATKAYEDAIFSIKFQTLGSPSGLTYEWHMYDTNTDEDIILSGQNDPITFAYTGDVQEYEVPYTGYYMLETWGAQGSAIFDGTGGQGGYSGGMIYLEKGQILYIVIGGQNGYNGGGSGGSVGGGATHIALDSNRGTLSNYESYKSEVLVVAGGGGGSERTAGGFGGGLTGGTGSGYTGYSSIAQGGTQTTGGSYGINSNGTFSGSSGSFGQGGSGSGSDTGPGGGGGWYGGGGTNYAGGAGGGSGYIDGLEMGVTQNGLRAGNGQAKITYMSYTVSAEDITAEKNEFEFYCKVSQGANSETSNHALLIVNETPMLDENYPEDAIVKVMLGETNADKDAYFYLNILNAGNPPGGTYKWYKADTVDGAGTLIAGSEGTFEEATNITVSGKPPVANFSEEFKYTEKVTVEDAEPFTKEFNYIEPQTSVVEIEPFTKEFTYDDDSYHSYTVPYDGYYQFELYGAQGGSYYGTGGKGGYTKGTIYLYAGDDLSIYLGGQPSDTSGGKNGGRNGEDGESGVYISGGGGATEVYTSKGRFSAGGGGGGARYSGMNMSGGTGGGKIAGNVSYVNYGNSTVYTSQNYGATQHYHSDGNFDTGWSYPITVQDDCCDGSEATGFSCYSGSGRGAGGGYIGGASYESGNRVYSGAGGSGYVSDADPNYEMINQAGVNEGNGKVVMTFLGGQEVTIEEDAVSYYEYEVPYSGNYKIEAWGAQGGSYYGEGSGGLGGYVTGTVYLEKGNNLCINIANQPTGTTSSNGGGNSYSYFSDDGIKAYISPGAGLTSVEYLDNAEFYMHAGGGGGSALYDGISINGGDAGGATNGGSVSRINYEDLSVSTTNWMGYSYNSGRVRYGCGSGNNDGYIPAINSDEYIYSGSGGTSSVNYYDYESEEYYYNETMRDYQNITGVNEGNGKVKISYLDTESITKEYDYYKRYDIPYDGYYLIETWGAQGGSTYGTGGLGAYAQVIVELSEGDYVNTYMGGQPGIYAYGVHGGNSPYIDEENEKYISGGGGLTYAGISQYNESTGSSNSISLYAGGGGGSASYQGIGMNGGNGGVNQPGSVSYVISGDSNVYTESINNDNWCTYCGNGYGSGGGYEDCFSLNDYYGYEDRLYAGIGGTSYISGSQYTYDSSIIAGVNEGHGKTKITYIGYTPDADDDEISGEDIFVSDGPFLRIPKSEITKEDDGTYFYAEVEHESGKFFSRSAELIVYYAPTIDDSLPSDATVYSGDDAVFMADVEEQGNPAQYQYQWYVRKGEDAEREPIEGANGKIYTVENATTEMNGFKYSCDIIHVCGTQTTREALLTVEVQLPVLLGVNYPEYTEKVVEYNTATFYVEIETPGIPDDYACTWQYRPNASAPWENCNDAWFRTQCNYNQDENGFIMNLSDVPRDLHGYQFRLLVRIEDGKYEVATNPATLTVYYDPIFVSPMDLVVIENTTANFNLQFTDMGNNPEIKVKWFKIDSAGNHSEVKVDTLTRDMLSTYSFTALRTDNGSQYYCVIEPSETGNMTSDKANLTVCYPPTLDSSKPEDMVLEDGRSGMFETAIAVPGFPDVYTYQWYSASAQSPDVWNKISGATNPTLTVNATKDMNGNRYKCIVSQSYPMGNDSYYTQDVTSRIATLTVYYAPMLDAEYPKDVNTVLNKGVSFEVKIATAGNPNEYQYQWFKKANAEAEGVAIDGATNTVYEIPNLNVTKELNNTYYYCKVYTVSPHATYGHYEVTSRTARLVVYYTPILYDLCPQDVETNEGDDAFFDVIIQTDGYSTNYQYQWYENTKNESAGGTPIDGATGRELLLTNVSREKNGKFYYCVVTNEGGEVYSKTAKLTVYYAPTDDKTYPKDITVIEGQSARFEISIATAGNPKEYTYVWNKVQNGKTTIIEGANNSSYTISKTTKNDNGSQYFCTIGNRAGYVVTRLALLTVYYVPELDASYPQNTTVIVGNMARFEVKIATKGNPDSYTYQWYVKENASSEGKVVNGAINNVYTTDKTTDSMDGYLYYCKVTNNAGTVTSNEATLTVLYPVKLNTEYPKDTETYEGKTASFEVQVATHGNPENYTYQWYKATSETAIGIEIEGATKASYTTPVTNSSDNNTYYFCKVTNDGGVATSRRAKLTVYYKPILDSNYPADVTVHDGNNASFEVEIATKGNPDSYTYQWFKEDGTKIDGATNTVYTLKGTKKLHETKYYCEVTNKAGIVKSRIATLFVKYLPVLDENYPKDLTVVVNNEATFEVVIEEDGNPATYSYQWYENGAEMTGEISSTLTLDADYVTKAINKNKYHCVVKNEVGTVKSRVATLHVLYPNELNPLYPEDVTVVLGKTATFKVVIEELGTGIPSYQWYSSKTNKNTGGTKIEGATSDTYSVVASSKTMNNTYYYCEVSNDGGMNASRAAKLTVYYTPVLDTNYPENIEVISGQEAMFEVKIATSGNPDSYTYQWYNQDGKIDGATYRIYSFVTSNSNDKDIYYCKVTNDAGTVTSESATLRVWWKATLDIEYPKDVEEIEGKPIAFEVKIASAGNPDDYLFQWYMANNVGDIGTLLGDGTAISYETIAHRNMNEKYFYCTVTNKH